MHAWLNKASIALVKLGAKCGIKLRQPYTFIGQKAFVQSARYAHARQFNRAKAQTKKVRVMLGRVIRDIQCRSQHLQLPAKEQARLGKLLEIAQRIHSQQRVRAEGAPPKSNNVHFPKVECIAKTRRGIYEPCKTRIRYEFGSMWGW